MTPKEEDRITLNIRFGWKYLSPLPFDRHEFVDEKTNEKVTRVFRRYVVSERNHLTGGVSSVITGPYAYLENREKLKGSNPFAALLKRTGVAR